MDILPYLAALLKTRKEVDLDGFGTFFKTRVPGRYDVETNTYLPPYYTLNFKQETGSNSFLANYISENRHVSSNTAAYYISEYASGLKQTLTDHNEAILPGIGKLIQEGSGLSFEADPEADLGHDFFGLPAVKALPAGAKSKNEELTAAMSTAEAAFVEEKTEVVPVPETIPGEEETDNTQKFDAVIPAVTEDYAEEGQETAEEFEEETARRRPFLKWLIVIFILVMIGAVAMMAKPELYENLFDNTPDTAKTSFDKNKLKPAQDTLTADTALTNKVKAALTDSSALAATDNKTNVITYEIIASAEKDSVRIKRSIANYNRMGFKAKVIPAVPGKLMQKISIATFGTLKEALDSLKSVRKKLKSKDPYVYPNPNKK